MTLTFKFMHYAKRSVAEKRRTERKEESESDRQRKTGGEKKVRQRKTGGEKVRHRMNTERRSENDTKWQNVPERHKELHRERDRRSELGEVKES